MLKLKDTVGNFDNQLMKIYYIIHIVVNVDHKTTFCGMALYAYLFQGLQDKIICFQFFLP